ncbi:MAG: Capsule biosynthesis protein CapA [Actinobacteria bacterium ADurb.Bin346]|nr:MAG: Capsule biosynthesis protein CapA [Actinobacteria bacterium ADurb.Bin346]
MGKNKAGLKSPGERFGTLIINIAVVFLILPSLLIVPGCSRLFQPIFQSLQTEDSALEETNQEILSKKKADYSLKVYIDGSIPLPAEYRIKEQLVESSSIYRQTDEACQGFNEIFEEDIADISFKLSLYSADASNVNAKDNLFGAFYYAPVVYFYSLVEDITWEQLCSLWDGSVNTIADIEGKEISPVLVLTGETRNLFTKLLGECKARDLKIVEKSKLRQTLETTENAISIVPFDKIDKSFKVVKINGISVLDSNISSADYPLTAGLSVKFPAQPFNESLKKTVLDSFKEPDLTNRESGDIVTILMTGVTALTRQVAAKMDQNGILYPAEKIIDILLDADMTHISNEVSFVEDCYAARPNTMVFCSKPEYMELIKYIDADVIELTGNHLNDYGSKWLEYTLDLYDKENLPYFGGGRNLSDAQKPAEFNIKGYKFAFLGANSFGPSSDWATADSAGAAPINTLDEESKEKDMKKYEEIVSSLKSQGYIVIFTFQYQETYNYAPTAQQVKDFERMSDAGAVIVSGSQAHQPQGFKIRDNGFINYGLGNLFFGQALGIEVKQGLIVKHIFYKGNLINTVLITTLIEDFSQPRPTEGKERADLLKAVFKGSIDKNKD